MLDQSVLTRWARPLVLSQLSPASPMRRSFFYVSLAVCVPSLTQAAQQPEPSSAPQLAPSQPAPGQLKLRYGSFDPLRAQPEVAQALRGAAEQNLSLIHISEPTRPY